MYKPGALIIVLNVFLSNPAVAALNDSCLSIPHEYYYIIHKDSLSKIVYYANLNPAKRNSKSTDSLINEINFLLTDLQLLLTEVRNKKYYQIKNFAHSSIETDTLNYIKELETSITRLSALKHKLERNKNISHNELNFLIRLMFNNKSSLSETQDWFLGNKHYFHWQLIDVFDTSSVEKNTNSNGLLLKHILIKKYINPLAFAKSYPDFKIFTKANDSFNFEITYYSHPYLHSDCIKKNHSDYEYILSHLNNNYYFIKVDLYY